MHAGVECKREKANERASSKEQMLWRVKGGSALYVSTSDVLEQHQQDQMVSFRKGLILEL